MKLSLVLKEKTGISHQKLEKLLVGKLRSIATITDYVEILKGFYGYVKPLEEEISANINVSLLPDYFKRRKSDALKDDLDFFGADLNLPFCDDLPDVSNTYSAIGALYVLEGSTLGGKIISKMVREKLGLESPKGLSFFSSYGEETFKMWEEFKNALDYRVKEKDQLQVIDASEQTFVKFRNWLA